MTTTATRYYLVELERPHEGWNELQVLAVRARSAAQQLAAEGSPVRFIRSIFVPDSESCFHLFEGTAEAVAEATRRAAIGAPAQIVESLDYRRMGTRTEYRGARR